MPSDLSVGLGNFISASTRAVVLEITMNYRLANGTRARMRTEQV